MSNVKNVLALLCTFAGALGGCATREQTGVDLQNRKDVRHLTFHSALAYPDAYRFVLDRATKCFSTSSPFGSICLNIEVRGQFYPDNTAEVAVHWTNINTDWVVGMATIRPAGSGAHLEIVDRFKVNLRLWTNVSEGKPCNTKQ